MIRFDEHILEMGWFSLQLVMYFIQTLLLKMPIQDWEREEDEDAPLFPLFDKHAVLNRVVQPSTFHQRLALNIMHNLESTVFKAQNISWQKTDLQFLLPDWCTFELANGISNVVSSSKGCFSGSCENTNCQGSTPSWLWPGSIQVTWIHQLQMVGKFVLIRGKVTN